MLMRQRAGSISNVWGQGCLDLSGHQLFSHGDLESYKNNQFLIYFLLLIRTTFVEVKIRAPVKSTNHQDRRGHVVTQ